MEPRGETHSQHRTWWSTAFPWSIQTLRSQSHRSQGWRRGEELSNEEKKGEGEREPLLLPLDPSNALQFLITGSLTQTHRNGQNAAWLLPVWLHPHPVLKYDQVSRAHLEGTRYKMRIAALKLNPVGQQIYGFHHPVQIADYLDWRGSGNC